MSESRIASRRVAAALWIFALSGAAGLIYQAVWSQYLGLFLGHAAYAQSLVLAIFMGGMALGAWWVSRRTTNWGNLLRAYAAVELIIGAAAALFHLEFLTVTGIAYGVIFPALDVGWLSAACKWTSAILLILPQSISLGMTFPLMSNGVMRRSAGGDGSILGGLYFSNSFGAAIGALIATFVLLPAVGLPGAMLVGAALNFVVALLAYLLARVPELPRGDSSAGRRELPAAAGPGSRLLLTAAFITGASSFVYEIGWVRMLSLALGSTVHAFELMLAAFIGGLAVGGLWIRRRIDGYADPLRVGGYVQILMGLAALFSLLLYDRSFDWVAWFLQALARSNQSYAAYNVATAAVAVAIMAPTAFFAGMTLPLFTLALLRRGAGEAAVGRIYAANTVGAIVGVSLAVHVLIPGAGLKLAMIAAAVADLALGIVLLRPAAGGSARQTPYFATLAIAGAATAATLLLARFDPLAMAAGVYRSGDARMRGGQKVIFYRDGKTASISVKEDADLGRRSIATNGKPDAAIRMRPGVNSDADEVTMVMLAALPLSLHPAPQEVANIGFGSGLTTHTMLTDPRVQRVDTIEIEPAVVEGAKAFRPIVERAYADPRSHLHIEDARNYFTAHKSKYDVIVSEPSNPWVSGVASLFSREFYRFVPKHLKPKGLFVQWIQLYEIDDELVSTIIAALQESFSDYRIYTSNWVDMVLVASADGPVGDIEFGRLGGAEMQALLKRVGLERSGDLPFRQLGERASMAPLVAVMTKRVNSDFYPILSLEAPRSRFRSTIAETFVGLPTADLPFLELLGNQALPAGGLTLAEGYPRTTYRKMARLIVLARGDTDPQGIAADLRLKMGFLREQIGRCRSRDDVRTQLGVIHQMAAETIPYLRPEEMRGLWIEPDWIQCSNQAAPVAAMLALLQAAAARNHPLTIARAEGILATYRADLPEAVSDYVLRSAMLAAIATRDFASVPRLNSAYGASMRSTTVAGNYRRWMLQMAKQELAKDNARASHPASVGSRPGPIGFVR
jgi:spermidine synthase